MNSKAFTIVESLLAVALLTVVLAGLYAAFVWGLKITKRAKLTIIASNVANEKIEELRNLSYEQVGVEGGYPTGTLPVSETVSRENIDFTVNYTVNYVDDVHDGQAPNDSCPNDYKVMEADVSWLGEGGGSVSGDTVVAPRNQAQECNQVGGLLSVLIFDASGATITNPLIEVENINTGLTKTAQPDSGEHLFVLPEGIDAYKILISKTGFTSQQTFGSGDVYNGQTIVTPENPHATVLEGQLTETSYSIDRVSRFDIKTLEALTTGNIYYVREVGSDVDDGLSPSSAFATIQKAASTTVAGDMVFVGAGTYEEGVVIQNSGTSGNEIAYIADVEGSFTGDVGTVTIDGDDFCFDINNKQFIGIYGFVLKGATTSAVRIQGGSSNIKLKDNLIFGQQGSGVLVKGSSDVTSTFNEIYSNNSHGFSIENSSQITVSRNRFYQNASSGVMVSGSNGVDLTFNRAYSNGEQGFLLTGSGSGSIKSNLIYDNGSAGISLSNSALSNALINNTLFQNQAQGIVIEQSSNNNILTNNIIASSTQVGIKVVNSTGIQNSYNDLWHNNPDYDGLSATSSSLNVDPLFVDPANDSFYLSHISAGQSEDSTLINAGSQSVEVLNMAQRATRTDGVVDGGVVDIGFHYSDAKALTYQGAPQPFGNPIPNTSFSIHGQKQVGTDSNEEPIYKYALATTSDSQGQKTLNDLEWDQYNFSDFEAGGIILNLLVSWPSPLPIGLTPNTTQEVRLGLEVNNTLLVIVEDAGTGEPVFSAGVHLQNTVSGYDKIFTTDSDGEAYFIPLESDNNYKLEVTAAGYQDFSETNILISGQKQKTVLMTPGG